MLAAVIGVAYLAVFAWFASPAWRAPEAVTEEKVPVVSIPVDGRERVASLVTPRSLPIGLPGAGEATFTGETSNEETSSVESSEFETAAEGGEEESFVSSPEGGSNSTNPPPATESSQTTSGAGSGLAE